MVHPRLQSAAYVAVLALAVGWVLHAGRGVLVPIVLAALAVFAIEGLTRVAARLPWIGSRLPAQARFALSILVTLSALGAIALVIAANIETVIAAAPAYQASLLGIVQSFSTRIGIEDEPTWASLRRALFAQSNVQALVGSTLASATAILATTVVVLLYVVFLLFERRNLPGKIDRIAGGPQSIARVRAVIARINDRVGAYLALKSFVSAVLAAVSWAVMASFGIELALFWAFAIGLLNFVPYLGSVLGVLLPATVALIQLQDLGAVLALVAALAVAQFVIGNFLDPYLLGNSLNLSPLAILASLAAWTSLWGIAGAFLAVPITAVMTIILSEFPSTRPVAVLLSRTGEPG